MDGAVLPDDAMIVRERHSRRQRMVNGAANELVIRRMNEFLEIVEADFEAARLEPVDTEHLIGPGDAVRLDVPLPAPELRNTLRLGQEVPVAQQLGIQRGQLVRGLLELLL